jgi:hypothetical protein
MGIEKTSLVDPAHANAFVTGLTFSGTGNASTMTAMTRFVDAVPEPPVAVPTSESIAAWESVLRRGRVARQSAVDDWG